MRTPTKLLGFGLFIVVTATVASGVSSAGFAAGARTSAPRLLVAARPATVVVPRLSYRQRVLPNGLAVYSIENHSSPTVAIQVWYRVGGKNDPEHKSGFAHLFEHLMFKATKNMKAETMDRLTEYVGGENNAYTTEDRTVYHETVPSNYLETLLWAEADRMANLKVDVPDFVSERAVVEEEFRQSVLAPPYGRLNEYVNAHSFRVHPYLRGVIGSIADLDAANIQDVRRFHSDFYRPDNAVLVVAGDFKPAQLDEWIDKYFGRIPKPAGEIRRIAVSEPPRTEARSYTETGPNVPLPAVVINYLVPSASAADAPALRMADVILSSGSSSRLYQSLVYRQHVASTADSSADLRADAGLFSFTTIAAGGKSVEEAEKATLAEIDRFKAGRISASELDKARNQLVTMALRRRETVAGKASALADAVVTLGDPERVNSEISRLQGVTAEDIQRVAGTYFTESNRVTVRYESGGQDQGGASHAKAAEAAPEESASTGVVESPPAPSAPHRTVFPTPVERNLPNGLHVVVAPRRGTGLASLVVSVRAGGREDPERAGGLAELTASLLPRGAASRSASEVAEAIEALGGSIDSGAGWDSSNVSMTVMSTQLDSALPILAEVVQRPTLASDEMERLQKETLDTLNVRMRSPGAIAQAAAGRAIFGEGLYGHPLGGTPESIRAIGAEDVRRFYKAHYRPNETTLVFSGDIAPETAFALSTRYFGDWKVEASTAPPVRADRVPALESGVIVVDKPDAGQAAVVLVQPGIRRGDPDYVVARVANGVLGEGYSSRINQEIRIKRGLSYGAGSRIDARSAAGLFVATTQTRNTAVPEVAALLKQELGNMTAETTPADELLARKANLTGTYARRIETGAGLASALADLTANDLPLSTLSSFPARVRAVTAEQVKQFSVRWLNPAQSRLIIVGDGRQFLDGLRKEFPKIDVIPIGELDLDRASLRR